MYFRGDDSEPIAFICVNIYGSADEEAFERMTEECRRRLPEDMLAVVDRFEESRLEKIQIMPEA